MRPDDIFDAIGAVSDESVTDAHRTAKAKKSRPWLKWGSLAAGVAVVIGIGSYVLPNLGGANSGGGSDSGLTYMSYAGPVFPLTLKEENVDMTATRDITLDFSDYTADNYGNRITVTDTYTLTNTGTEDLTVTALYPYAATAFMTPPTVTVNGESTETTIYAGKYNASRLSSFVDYERIIAGGGYPDCIFESSPSLDIPVYVYKLHDYVYTADERATNPTLQISFNIDYGKSYVYSYNMNGGVIDAENGYGARSCSSIKIKEGDIDYKYKYPDDAYIVIIGDDIKSYTLQGYRDGGCDKGEEVDDLSCTVTRYESTFGEMLSLFIDDFTDEGYGVIGEKDMFLELVAEYFDSCGAFDFSAEDYGLGFIEDAFSQARMTSRVMYLTFDVTVPAGGSVDVSAVLEREASMDFVGNDLNRHGYAVASRLGSCIAFESQTATLANCDGIEIIRQNFGFDPAGGKTTVSLSTDIAHYYIDVRQKQSE